MSDPYDYRIGILCAITIEYTAVQLILDERHPAPGYLHLPDHNHYTLGRIGEHNVVIAVLPEGDYGTVAAATGSRDMMHSFPNIKIGLMVGVGGAAPGKFDVRLGDLVVGLPKDGSSGVLQYDFGKTIQNQELQLTKHFDKAPAVLRAAAAGLRSKLDQGLRLGHIIDETAVTQGLQQQFQRPSNDRLFKTDIIHKDKDCEYCEASGLVQRSPRTRDDPVIHYGLIASADYLIKDAELRDRLANKYGILCFEMEAAGLADQFPCLIIRGLSDYSDTHKNKDWQGYAALVASVYAKELLYTIDGSQLLDTRHPNDYSLPFGLPGAPIISTFSGREEELHILEHLLPVQKRAQNTFILNEFRRRKGSLSTTKDKDDRQTVVIYGLGGMGKTQLAIEFARIHKNDYSAVLWMDGKDQSSLQLSFVSALKRLKVAFPSTFKVSPGSVPAEEAVDLVLRWLDEAHNSHWLLIFDNVDNPEIKGVSGGLYDISKYFPTTLHGHVIITTRCSLLRMGEQIHLRKITNDIDCLEIISRTSARSKIINDPNIEKLLRKVDGLPLALSAAGSYLRFVPDSVEEYLENYEASWISLQSATPSLPEFEGRTLEVTWNVTMDYIKTRDLDAWRILELWVFLSNQDLWYELLAAGRDSAAPEWFIRVTQSKMTFAKHMRTLCSYGFVDIEYEPAGYRIHNCLQDWLKSMICSDKEQELKDLALACIAHSVPVRIMYQSSLGDLPLQRRLLGHADHYLKYIHVHLDDASLQRNLFGIGKLFENSLDCFKKAETIYLTVLDQQQKSLGIHAADTLRTASSLINIYRSLCKMDEYEALCRRVLVSDMKTADLHDIWILRIMVQFGWGLFMRDRFWESEKILLQAKASSLQATEWEPSDKAFLLSTLAEVYLWMSRLQESKVLLEECLSGMQDPKDLTSKLRLDCLEQLGEACYHMKEFPEAEEYLLECYRIREGLLGTKHGYCIQVANTLGMLYTETNRLDEAEEIIERAIANNRAFVRNNKAFVWSMTDSLAMVFLRKNNPEKAEETMIEAISGLEKATGLESPEVMTSVQHLGQIYRVQGRLMEAEKAYTRAYEGFLALIGPKAANVMQILKDLDEIRDQQKRLKLCDLPA